ncbi:hypothetical protein [Cereibacter johrii]|uniref:hypothetical protein n=1 Tax=Cereibacter johrii TaxID=445629 RepID=UPI000DCF3724|nr:hypothetical protein [Cereibacter johrii]RAZ82374.1 hypothetical protein DDV93_19535 [Cereibacter johrii]
MFDMTRPDEADPLCPSCGSPFSPRRRDQRYCAKPCAKAASRNATRGSRAHGESAAARHRHEARKGRLRGLAHAFHETPPAYRAEFLVRLIAEGRKLAELRDLVTLRCLLRSWSCDEGTGRLNIAHVLDHFCREVYGLRSFEVLDPARVLPPEAELAFPATYFGPDAPSIYEDGSLRRGFGVTTARQAWSVPVAYVIERKSTNVYDWRTIGRAMRDHGWTRYADPRDPDAPSPFRFGRPVAISRNSPSAKMKENPNADPLRGYLRRDPEEFFGQLRVDREDRPLKSMPEDVALAVRQTEFPDAIGTDTRLTEAA